MTEYYNFKSLAIGLSLGCILHVLADILTHSGTALFFPFSKKRVKMAVVTTDGIVEKGVFAILVGVLVLRYM
ncbi:metal-dependent hydrolase [Alkaliphilus transvaalensis]|uniref:metal-dependent hydrolase n=1 Tax=Alkaliphilus transvaalensis TaxID=114628 RepID=UPI0038BB928D